jgi:hypothetical protein
VSKEATNRTFDDLARGLAEGSISRRRALKLFAGSAIAALIPSTRAMAAIPCPRGTVKICHVPQRADGTCRRGAAQTLCVSPEEAATHAGHPCDCCGGCGGTDDCREPKPRRCFSTSTTTSSTTSTSTTTSTTTTTTPTTTTSTTTAMCLPNGANCSAVGEPCCSGNCDGAFGVCIPPPGPNSVGCRCNDGTEFDRCSSASCFDPGQVDAVCSAVCASRRGTANSGCSPNGCS